MAYVLNFGAAASYAECSSQSNIGTASNLSVMVAVRGADLKAAASAFSTWWMFGIGGSTGPSTRLFGGVDGGNGDVRIVAGVEDFDNGIRWTTGAYAPASLVDANYYICHFSHAGSGSSGHCGLGAAGAELVGQATAASGTMASNAANGIVRVGARTLSTSEGFVGRIDGIAVYGALLTTASQRYGNPANTDANILAYWPWSDGAGAQSLANDVSGGQAMVLSSTSAPTYVAGGSWNATGGGGTPSGKPTHMMHYARMRRAA